jgi:CRISPR-associated protein Cmr6
MPASYRQSLNDIYTYQHKQLEALHKRQRKRSNEQGKQPDEQGTLDIHRGLWLDKYIERQERDDVGMRAQLVREVSSISEPDIYEPFYNQWKKVLEDEHKAKTREAHTKGRMIVGLGGESVLETSIALHRTYGTPYIPGSSLKGLAASYVCNYLGEEWQKGNESNIFNILFGDTKGAGYITFFDALYIPGTGGGMQKKALYSDVITVHHQQYYQRGANISAPADWDSPIPVPFLSATGGYLIALTAPDLEHSDRWLDKTFKILEYALRDIGIGAKTSSGYGRMTFKKDEEIETPINPELAKLIEEIKNLPDKNFSSSCVDKQLIRWLKYARDPHGQALAQAIVDRVVSSGNERNVSTMRLYQQLRATLQ